MSNAKYYDRVADHRGFMSPLMQCGIHDIMDGNEQALTLIPAWISNYVPRKVWDEITYPFLNFNGCTVEV